MYQKLLAWHAANIMNAGGFMKKKVTPDQLMGKKKGMSGREVADLVSGKKPSGENPIYEEMRRKQGEIDENDDIIETYTPDETPFVWRPPEQ